MIFITEPAEGLKIRGGASSNVLAIICPNEWNRVN